MCSSSTIITWFTFHISSICEIAGLSRMEAYSIFLSMSVISVLSHLTAGWASDRMPLKYLLMILVATLGVGCIGILDFKDIFSRWVVILGYGIRGGI